MANTTITNLPTVTALNGTEPLLGVQSSASVQITTGQIASLAAGLGGNLPFTVSVGGTGDTTFTQYALLFGNGTDPIGVVTPPAGTNYVLVASAGGAPAWQATIPVTAGVDSISFGSTGLTPSSAQAGVVTVAGTLIAANGGTGQSSYTIGDVLYASTTTTLSRLADVATGSVLISGGVGVAPSYSSSPTLSGTVTASKFIANTAITGSLTQGAFAYGTLPYSDIEIYASYQTNVNNYSQIILHNSSSGTVASSDVIVGNNNTTATTYYGDFGMNSSGFTGSGAFNAANAVFLAATSGDLAIGTTTSNAIHFVVNNGTTDAATISSAGVFSLGTALAVGSGGTGQSSNWTQWGAIYASTTGALSSTAAGVTGQVLIGNTGAAPTWATISTSLVSSFSAGTTGLTPSSATTGAVTLAGTLVAANGGTGQNTYVIGDLLYASTTTALSRLADVATGSILISGGVGVAPSWGLATSVAVTSLTFGTTGLTPSTATQGAITVAGTLVAANGGTGQNTYAVGDLLYASTTTALSRLADVATGSILISGGVGVAPSWGLATSVAVTSISFGTTGLTPSAATQGAVTVAGTLVAANGGTGQNTYVVGDLLYASTTTALSRLADVATGSVLVSGGTGVAPAYSSTPTVTSLTATTSVLSSGAGGVGYSTGAGGAVTQVTSRTTGVTLSKTTGAITMFTAAGSATAASFTVTNSTVAATDVIVLNIKSGASNTYILSVTTVAAGLFNIIFYTTGGTASDTPIINFAVIKGVTA